MAAVKREMSLRSKPLTLQSMFMFLQRWLTKVQNKEQQNIFGKIWTIYKLLFSRGSTSTLSSVNFLQNLSWNICFSILCIWYGFVTSPRRLRNVNIWSLFFCVFYEYFIDDVIWLAKRNIYCTICDNTRWCNIAQSAPLHWFVLRFVFIWLFHVLKSNYIGFQNDFLNIPLFGHSFKTQ